MDKKTKVVLVGLGAMVVGGILVVVGLLQVPTLAKVLILVGGGVGFVGYKIYDKRNQIAENNVYFG